jgi:hypothetical protein
VHSTTTRHGTHWYLACTVLLIVPLSDTRSRISTAQRMYLDGTARRTIKYEPDVKQRTSAPPATGCCEQKCSVGQMRSCSIPTLAVNIKLRAVP